MTLIFVPSTRHPATHHVFDERGIDLQIPSLSETRPREDRMAADDSMETDAPAATEEPKSSITTLDGKTKAFFAWFQGESTVRSPFVFSISFSQPTDHPKVTFI